MSLFVLLAAATTAAALPDVTVIGSRVATAQEDIAANVTALRRETLDSERQQELALRVAEWRDLRKRCSLLAAHAKR